MSNDAFPEIPEFLKITAAERREAWAEFDRRKQVDPSIKITMPNGLRAASHASPGSGQAEMADADKAA